MVNMAKRYSEKVQYILDRIGYDKIVEVYEDRTITEVTVKQGGDYCTYRLYICSDGEWMVTAR